MNVACNGFGVRIVLCRRFNNKRLTVTNLSTSSMASTGALRYSTHCHSIQFKGVMANRD